MTVLKEIKEDKKLQNKCHRYEMYSAGNTVNNYVISLHGDIR